MNKQKANDEGNSGLTQSSKLYRLLIIDDEPDMCSFLTELLQSDYHLICAADGEQGFEFAIKYQPDLIILDFMLPECNGIDLCQALKKSEQLKSSTKIIVLTARVDENTKIAALKQGADDFLTKPFSSTEIKQRVSNLLAQSSLQHNLEKTNQELKATLADLQKTLAELKHTQALLVHNEKIRSLGTMSAGLLHEVNNPVNFVVMALGLLNDHDKIKQDEDLQDTVKRASEGIKRVSTIISDLKTFAYPSQMDQLQAFFIDKAIFSALRFLSYENRDAMIKVSNIASAEVLGAETHIVQVLMNLVKNARQAVSKKMQEQTDFTPEIVISTQRISDKKLQIRVQDNGIGIEPQNLHQIFEPFYTTKKIGEGLGLGLSICYTIMANHGSCLQVVSKFGEGTRFFFDLPIVS